MGALKRILSGVDEELCQRCDGRTAQSQMGVIISNHVDCEVCNRSWRQDHYEQLFAPLQVVAIVDEHVKMEKKRALFGVWGGRACAETNVA